MRRIRLLDGRLKLRHLLLVDALTERGSLVAAAAHLRVTQPVLTRSLRELEDIVGVELYERGARGVTPTIYGTAFTEHARAALAQLTLAERHLAELADAGRGTVTVGSHLAGSDALLPAAIARLKKARPLVTVVVRKADPDELHNDLEAGRVDLVVGRLTSSVRSTTQQRVLYREPFRLSVRSGHPATSQHDPQLTDLLDFSWIVPVTGTALRRELESLLVGMGLDLPRDRVECTSFPIVRQLLLETDMIAALPVHLGADDRLAALPTSLAPLSQAVGVTTPADRHTSPSAAALLRELDLVAEGMSTA
ncbi:MAG: LysR family transcriptional regulator [Pseudonocardiaceae bacterium]|nr:MAG: LysR family transcriptional regulator [Pseudonocardiaceae bacterium]